MALEDLTGTKYIDDLNSSNPAAGDNVSEGDDHIRGIKNVLKVTFPSIDGAITATDTELNYVDGVTSAVQTQFDAITANDWVTSARIADDAVTSALIADDAITSALIADDAVVTAAIADDAITSALIADDAVVAAAIADDAVVQAAIADDAVDEARLQVSNAGSNGQFLAKQSGNTGGLTWTTVVSEDYIPDGSVMVFFQANAPTGWTKVTTQNDKTLRVVSGTGGGTGGDWAMTSGETSSSNGAHVHAGAAHTHSHNLAAGAHTLSTSEMPSHDHSVTGYGGNPWNSTGLRWQTSSNSSNQNTGNAGGGGSHSHSTSGSITNSNADTSGSAGAHTHTIAAPQYIDVIICSKDA